MTGIPASSPIGYQLLETSCTTAQNRRHHLDITPPAALHQQHHGPTPPSALRIHHPSTRLHYHHPLDNGNYLVQQQR